MRTLLFSVWFYAQNTLTPKGSGPGSMEDPTLDNGPEGH